MPYAEFKTYNLRKNPKIKPALAISEGVFNDLGITISVQKHGSNDRFLTDVIIHQKTTYLRNSIVIKSEDGELKMLIFQM